MILLLQRFNVALTRAMSKLIVIGCPYVLGYDKNWLKYIEYCEELNAYFGPPYIRRTNEVKDDIMSRCGAVRFKDSQYKDQV